MTRGLPALFGVALGMGLMMFVVAFGLGSVILGNPIVLTVLKWCGAVVLLWLAWKIATAGRPGAAADGQPVGLVGAAAFQLVNPKSWLVCTSAAATFLDQGAGSALSQSAAFALTFVPGQPPELFSVARVRGCPAPISTPPRAPCASSTVAMGALLAASVVFILSS